MFIHTRLWLSGLQHDGSSRWLPILGGLQESEGVGRGPPSSCRAPGAIEVGHLLKGPSVSGFPSMVIASDSVGSSRSTGLKSCLSRQSVIHVIYFVM